jgi:hypothetical protein
LTLTAIPIHINMVTLHPASKRLRLVKCWKTNFGLLLSFSGLAVRFGFDSVQAYLLGVILVGPTLWIVPCSSSCRHSWSLLDATSAESVKAATEE